MTTTIPTIESDPCGRATALREIRDRIAIGGAAEDIEFQAGNGTRRRVRYTKADGGALGRLILEAQAACDRKNGRAGGRMMLGGRA